MNKFTRNEINNCLADLESIRQWILSITDDQNTSVVLDKLHGDVLNRVSYQVSMIAEEESAKRDRMEEHFSETDRFAALENICDNLDSVSGDIDMLDITGGISATDIVQIMREMEDIES